MFRLFRSRAGLSVGLVAAGLAAVALAPADRAASAQPAAPLPEGLRFVPTDAAVFVHADAAQLWGGPIGKAVREADPKLFDELSGQAKTLFGVTPDQFKTVTLFWPRLKGPQDTQGAGVVLTFTAAYDAAKLKAGVEKTVGKGPTFSLHTPDDRVAVVLVGLDAGYATPTPADKTGPLTAALRKAAADKPALLAGATLANLPDEIRGDNLPEEVRPFQSLFKAETITGSVELNKAKELSVEVRVKAATAVQAGEAEKALGLLVTLAQEGLSQFPREFGKDAEKDPALKDIFAILKAAQAGLKGVKFDTEGTETRARVAIPADLPFGRAFAAATGKVREAAARAKSSNNLKQIALALHNYHDTHGAMPPAAVVDKTGKPVLSWRVLILPYVEQDALYRQFKLDEPWDSPNNIKLLDKMPNLYALPTPTKAKANETHYRVFVGNGAAWDYLKGHKLPEFTDGTSNTLLVATAADAVPWTKPDELDFDPDKDMTQLLGFLQNNVCMVAIGDGSVRAMAKTIAQKTLHAFITRNGGEVIDFDDF